MTPEMEAWWRNEAALPARDRNCYEIARWLPDLLDALDAERRKVKAMEVDVMNGAADYQVLVDKFDAERRRVAELEHLLPTDDERAATNSDARTEAGEDALRYTLEEWRHAEGARDMWTPDGLHKPTIEACVLHVPLGCSTIKTDKLCEILWSLKAAEPQEKP